MLGSLEKSISTNERIPPVLTGLLCTYFGLLDENLLGWLLGFYLVGSIALNGFDPVHSDIDFVAVSTRKACPGDLEKLKKTIKRLSGSILPGKWMECTCCRAIWAALKQPSPRIRAARMGEWSFPAITG